MITIDRGYIKHGRERIKFLTASVYHDPSSPDANEWIYRLPAQAQETDKRKFIFTSGAQYCHDWFARLPVGCWTRILF